MGRNGIGYIPLNRGLVAKVDPCNVEKLSSNNWTAAWNPHTRSFVAVRVEQKNGKQQNIKMHRIIKGATDFHTKVDHENHDTLDNRNDNLRICNNTQNICNSILRSDNTSGYKGVSYFRSRNKYRSYINLDGRQRHLGYFDTPEEASARREEVSKELHKEFAFSGMK
jgi:hypothetical protein